MTEHKPCRVCPARLSLEKRVALMMHTLAVSRTPEAVTTLEQVALLAGLNDQALCETAEDWQI